MVVRSTAPKANSDLNMLAVLGIGGVSAFTASAPRISQSSTSGRSSHLTALAEKSSSRGKLNARIIGVGAASPDTRVSNVELEAVVETSDEWIAKRTGALPVARHDATHPNRNCPHVPRLASGGCFSPPMLPGAASLTRG